jgi:hypothetical protein
MDTVHGLYKRNTIKLCYSHGHCARSQRFSSQKKKLYICILLSPVISYTRFLHWETDVGLGACIRRLCWLLRNACALPDLYAHTWSITNSLLHSKMSRSQIMVPDHLIFLLERSMTSKVEDYGSREAQ